MIRLPHPGPLPVLIAALTLARVAIAPAADATPPRSARALIDHQHWKQARALLEAEQKERPRDPTVLTGLCQVRLAFHDLDAAQKLGEQAIAIAPNDAEAHEALSEVFGERASNASMFKVMGLAGRFRKEAETALHLDPKQIDARLGLMEFHVRAPGIAGGDKKKALRYAQEVGEIDASKGELALARYCQETGDTNAVEAHYRSAIEKDPNDVEARVALASWCTAPWRQKWDEAEKNARAASEAEPDRAIPYLLLASIYAHQQRWSDLDAVLSAADAACPDDRNPWYQSGRILLLDGTDLPRAEKSFRRFLEIEPEPNGPTLAHGRWRLALVLEKEGKRSEAVAELEEALKLKPDLDPAKKDLKRMKG
ncbi:MAG TPA: tetratricopeptide repeat protein [Candidatus Sulfotelmatobacter sp.]|nr:tetratricopeptide repeat protein [Candidatus Sulfotelmatobacter sp.]